MMVPHIRANWKFPPFEPGPFATGNKDFASTGVIDGIMFFAYAPLKALDTSQNIFPSMSPSRIVNSKFFPGGGCEALQIRNF